MQSAHVDPHHGGADIEGEDARVEIKGAGLDHRIGLEVTGVEIHATAILFGGGGVVVPGRIVRASGDFLLITGAVSIGVDQAVPVAIAVGVGENAAAIVVVGIGIEVAGCGIDAAAVEAGSVIDRGSAVVVVGFGIDAAAGARAVGAVKAQVETQVAFAHAVLEDLHEQGSRNVTVRRQLRQQHFVVVARQTVAVVLGHEPRPARGVVHDDVASVLESEHPILPWAFHDAHVALGGAAVCLLADADRHPRIVLEIREETEEHRIDGVRRGIAEGILVEGGGRAEVQREHGIATHRGHDVIGVDAFHVDPIGGHAGEHAGFMFSKDIYGQSVAGDLRMAHGHCGQAKEEGSQTVHVSTIWVGQS